MVNSARRGRFERQEAGHLARLGGDQIRGSDITFWGLFALICWAIAVFSANVSALIPPGVLGGLHATRLDGGSLNQLRSDVAALETEATRLKQENTVLLQRFMVSEESAGGIARRVGALELSVPRLLEAAAAGSTIDRGAVTAGIGAARESVDVPGGAVSITTSPMVSQSAPSPDVAQAMPQALNAAPVSDSAAFGVALGPPIEADAGPDAWRGMTDRVGTLLIGLAPLLADVEGGPGKRLVAGPIGSEAEARQLCGQMAKVGIACASVPFVGVPMIE
jgi:hypothetical protein